MKILYVDDCGLELKLASAVIKSLGECELIKVKTKKEVMSTLLTTTDIDLIVTDYYMKGETGIDVVKMVRQLKYDIPVIVLTSATSESISSDTDIKLFDGIYQKTAKVDKLWTSIISRFRCRNKT